MLKNISRYRSLRYPSNWGVRCFSKTTITFKHGDDFKKSSVKDKISNYLVQFLKQEATGIKNVLSDNDIYRQRGFEVEKVDDTHFQRIYGTLDNSIKTEMSRAVDVYNKFTLLLTYDPIEIHPDLYITLYNNLKVDLDDDSRALLLRRLAFHQNFEACWDILLTNSTTLDDIEEGIEVVTAELEKLENIKFSVIYLLISSYKVLSYSALSRTITDTICFKYGISKDFLEPILGHHDVLSTIHDYKSLDAYKSEHWETVNSHLHFRSLYLRTVLRLFLNSTEKDSLKLLAEFNELAFVKDATAHKGWLTSLVPTKLHADLKNGALISKEQFSRISLQMATSMLKLNICDVLFLTQISGPETAFGTYKLYRDNFKQNMNTSILNHLASLILKFGDLTQAFQFTYEIAKFLDDRTLLVALSLVRKSDPIKLKKLIKRIDTLERDRRLKIFGDFIEENIQEVNTLDNVQLLTTSFYRTGVSSETLSRLFSKIHYSSLDRESLTMYFDWLVGELNLSSYLWLEVVRSILLRAHIHDYDLLFKLYDAILRKSLKARGSGDVADDFQAIYSASTETERARFHNRLRALAQCFSLLDSETLSHLLNELHGFTFGEEFNFVNSESGRKYIFNNLLSDVMRFVYRSNKSQPEKGIHKIKDVLGKLNFDATIVQLNLFKYIVRTDPAMCFKLLDFHEKRKVKLSKSSMRYMFSGIFGSEKLEDNEKLKVFQNFHVELDRLGYNHSISKFTAIELINTLISATENDPTKSLDSVKWVLKYGKQKRIPKNVAIKWAKKFGI